jgi:hypothetical protein
MHWGEIERNDILAESTQAKKPTSTSSIRSSLAKDRVSSGHEEREQIVSFTILAHHVPVALLYSHATGRELWSISMES